MSQIPEELKYSKSHEWVRLEEDGTVTIGITDHAQHALGDLVFVELAEVGQIVAINDQCGVVESVKAASDIYSPIAGEVVEANELLTDQPELVNTDPYDDGWLFKLNPTEDSGLDDLLTAAEYSEFVAAEEE
jgi:glycine cleavage system H protein